MSEPDFLKGPFDLVADLIQAAFDPNASAQDRAQACERIRGLSETFLRDLALDGDWRHLLGMLAGEETGELAGDGPWSSRCPIDNPPEPVQTPAGAHAIRPLFCLYIQDLRRLVSDDYLDTPPVPIEPLHAEDAPSTLVEASAGAVVRPREPTPEYMRRLPWTLLNPGIGLLAMADRWPGATEALAAYWDEVVRRRAPMGVPYRLAEVLARSLAASPSRREIFDEIARWVHTYVEREVFDFLTLDDLTERHFDLRLGVASWLRGAELTEPKTVAAIEIYATCTLLRHAATADLMHCWREGKADPKRATEAFRRFNQRGDPLFERALRAVLRQPTDAMAARVTAQERQALNMVRHVRQRIPHVHERGALWREGEH
ncbi:MAG TPA: hypothetical protein VF178_12575 [Gemmatimonadaceae bacterium]